MLLLKLASLLFAAYLALCSLLFLFRWKLVFHPTQANPFFTYPWKKNQITISHRNTSLCGWLLECPEFRSKPFLIYFGGNAEGISHHLDNIAKFPNASLLFMSYRGYDESTGKPSERGLYADALAVYDYLVNVRKIEPDQIFLVGRSIGASVASYAASQRPVKGLILITPFDRIATLVRQFFCFRPFAWILRSNFNTVEYLKKANVDTLVLTAGRDEVVPKSSTENLLNACRSKISLKEFPSADHQNISDCAPYYEAIHTFIDTQHKPVVLKS